jgi:hypothetical protein
LAAVKEIHGVLIAHCGRKLQAVTHPINGGDAVAVRVNALDLFSDVLDVTVDGTVTHIALVVVRVVQQLSA